MKYISNHIERDNKLPIVRAELLEKILISLRQKPGVVGVFLGGSLAKDNHDLYSDIDLRIVVTEEKYAEYVHAKQELPKQWGNILFYEDLYPTAPYTIVHYDSFIKVDIFYYSVMKLQPSIWLKDIKVLLDKDGILHDVRNKSNEFIYSVSQADVIRWKGKVFSYVHEVYRRVQREEYYYALAMMNNLRLFIVQGWDMNSNRQPNDGWDWSMIEGSRSHLEPWQLSLLEGWMCERDQIQIMNTLQSMIPEIRKLYSSLCDRTGLDREPEKFDIIVNLVL
jgi:predicted nucleotidyltransferase